jgi:hypothetical protein
MLIPSGIEWDKVGHLAELAENNDVSTGVFWTLRQDNSAMSHSRLACYQRCQLLQHSADQWKHRKHTVRAV